MVTLDRETWARIFPFLDESHDVPLEQLEDWLAKVTAKHPDIGPPLRAMLTQRYRDDTGADFLERPLAIPAAAAPLIGESVGAYTIQSLLGRGGMGEVWLARRSDGHFKGLFAVKFLNPASRTLLALDRFKREGRLLARLAHPNIARLIDAGVMPDGRPYLILEYVEGEHIDQFCNSQSLSPDARVRLFMNVAAAVAHAHSKLVVHRDIKPSNVLVTRAGEVKLLDFGVAKLLSNDLADEDQSHATRKEDVALTPDFAAPEQILGDPPSTATDVYQLGVLLYLLLVGELPMGGAKKTRADQVRAALDEIPARMSDVAPLPSHKGLRGDLDAIVAKALRKRPDERYDTAAAFGLDIKRYLEHEPVRARDGAFAYLAAKFIRRHRGAVAGSIAAVLALVAVASFAFVQMREAQTQRDLAFFHERRGEAENQFLTQVMSTVGSDSKPVTPKEILDKGISMLDQQYSGDPSFRADLLIRMASSFINIADDEKGYAALLKAEKIAAQLHDPSLTAEIECAAVEPNIIKGSLDEAAVRLRKGLDALARVAHPGFVVRARCMDAQAFVIGARGDFKGASQIAEKAVAMLDAAGETRDTVYYSLLSHIAVLYSEAGDPRKGFEFAQRTVDAIDKNGWAESENAVNGHLNLAIALTEFGEYKTAFEETSIAIKRARSGTNGGLIEAPLTLSYGVLLAKMNREDESIQTLNESITAAHRDGDVWSERLAHNALARTLTSAGRFDEAAAEIKKSRELVKGNQQPEERQALVAAAIMEAGLSRAQGDLPLARTQIETVMGGYDPRKKTQSQYQGVLLEATRIALGQERFSDAEGYATQALTQYLVTARKPEWSAQVGQAELLLAKAQRGEGNVAKSRDSARSATLALTSSLGADNPMTLEASAISK